MMEKEKLWNADYLRTMTANFMLFFAFYVLTPLLPIYLSETFGASKDTIGVVLSGYTVAALLARPFCGYLVDGFSRYKVLMFFFFAFFAFFIGYLAAGTLLLFAIVRTLHGITYGGVTVANSTVAIDVLPSSRRNEGIGYYGLSNNLAMAIAPSVGIAIYHWSNDFSVLFWVALVIALIGLLVDSQLKLPVRPLQNNKRKLSFDRFFLVRAWLLAINMAFFGFCFGVLSNYLAIYSRDILNITGGTGVYFLILSMGLFFSRLQGAKALRQGKLVENAQGGMVISLVGYTLFVLCPNAVGYYLSAFLIGIGNGHMYPAFLNMFISVAHHNERGTANSSILVAWDLGFGIGIFIGGIVAEYFGYVATFWTVALLNAVGVALFFAATRRFYIRCRESMDLQK